MNKSNWFCIEPYVHIAVKRNKALLYNTLSGNIFEETEPPVVDLIDKLDSKENLLVVPLNDQDLTDPTVADFIGRVRSDYLGDLIDASLSRGRPIQMRPQAKVQKDVEEENAGGLQILGEGIMEYLSELNLYVNGACNRDCSYCGNAYKQFLHCTKGNPDRELPIEEIDRLFTQAGGSAVHKVGILGGDIFAYSKFRELLERLNAFSRHSSFYTHYRNIPGRDEQLEHLKHELTTLQVSVDFPLNEETFQAAHTLLKEAGLGRQANFDFIIQRVEDVAAAQETAARFNIDNFTFQPLYNGDNFDFFEENIFIDKEGIGDSKPGLKEILTRMKLNPLNFGKLTVLADKAIHANVNEAALGILGQKSLYDVVLDEMKEGTSWRRSRDKVGSCGSCVYCFVCPPPTNYEYSLGRNNICHISST